MAVNMKYRSSVPVYRTYKKLTKHESVFMHKVVYSRVKYTILFAVKAGIVGDCNMLVAEAMQPSGRFRLPNSLL